MPANDPIRFILDRVALEHPNPSHFDGYELECWPKTAEEELLQLGLLIKTPRATATVCGGCEMSCHKSVVARQVADMSRTRAFIYCDESPDLGRIPIEIDRLRRYRATIGSIGQFAVATLGLKEPKIGRQETRLALGILRGRYGDRQVSVAVRDRHVVLVVGQQVQLLTDIVSYAASGVSADKQQIKRMLNRKELEESPITSIEPSNAVLKSSQDAALAKRNQEIYRIGADIRKRGESWQQIAEEIARMPFIRSTEDGLRPIKASTVLRLLARRPR